MAIQMICDGMLRLFALGGERDIAKLEQAHRIVLDEWEDKYNNLAAKIIEHLMEGVGLNLQPSIIDNTEEE
jgi:hypothetical protein